MWRCRPHQTSPKGRNLKPVTNNVFYIVEAAFEGYKNRNVVFMKEHWFFVVNPVSGKGRGLEIWRLAQKLLDANELEYSFAISEFHTHTLLLVAEKHAAGVRHFIGIGGDGTLNEMVNAVFSAEDFLPQEKIIFGLLPVGTGNDWVRGQKEKLTLQNLIEKLRLAQSVPHDIGVITTSASTKKHFFINVAGAGLDGNVVHEIETLSKKGAKGKAIYLRGLLKALFKFQSPACTIYIDEKLVFSGRTLLLAASKGQFFGGGMHISPAIKPNSGTLDFTLVKKVNTCKILPQLPKLFTGKIGRVTFVAKQFGPNCQIQSDVLLPVQADGEWVGGAKNITFLVLPSAVHVLV